ncbi:MAG: hypothetical protein IPJ03_12030 [Ignavibacteriales bacterium]|nr:hypothetical protein [Ignavibacteriales bacterium]
MHQLTGFSNSGIHYILDGVLTSNTDVDAKLTILQTERDTRLNLYLNSETGLIVPVLRYAITLLQLKRRERKVKILRRRKRLLSVCGKRLGKIPHLPAEPR